MHAIKSRVKAIEPYTLKVHRAKVKINQNESPYDLPNDLKAEIARRAQEKAWSRYPDVTPSGTIAKLAQFTGWAPDGLLVGNGSNEMIQDILTVVVERGRRVLIPQPTFTLYKLLASILGGNIIEVPLDSNLCFDLAETKKGIQKFKPDLLIFCSPNNPTGCVITKNELEEILPSFGGLVIVDEAYHEFSGQTVSDLLPRFANLVIIRSFSNAMAMAGLRLGYLMAHPRIVEQVAKAKLPYNVNVFTLTAAEVVLENLPLVRQRVDEITAERERLYQGLADIRGIKPYRSHGNFIIFESDKDPEFVFNELLAQEILVRDVSYYPLLSKALRVSVGTPDENNTFLSALKRIFNR